MSKPWSTLLKEARLNKGLSISESASKLGTSVLVYEALEDGDFDEAFELFESVMDYMLFELKYRGTGND